MHWARIIGALVASTARILPRTGSITCVSWPCVLVLLMSLYIVPSSACLEPMMHVDLPRDIDLTPDFYLDNGTTSNLSKRYFRRAAGRVWDPTTTGSSQRWDIIYCFGTGVSSADRATLKDLIDRAWQLWVAADGTPPPRLIDHLTLTQGSGAECNTYPKNVLGIVTNTDGTLYTNAGAATPFISADMNFLQGYARGPLAAMAHEIGHAWGLLHEHQRADAQVAGGGRIQFDCTALADWVRVGSPLATDPICTSVVAADNARFSAKECIAYIRSYGPQYSANVDYNSIMMYHGTAGARPDNGPNSVNGFLVTFRDTQTGAPFVASNVPSTGDVAGLASLYPKSGTAPVGSDPNYRNGAEVGACIVAGIFTVTNVQ